MERIVSTEEVDETPPVRDAWKKHSRRQLRRQGMVPMKHLNGRPSRVWFCVRWGLLVVVLFWFLHFVLGLG